MEESDKIQLIREDFLMELGFKGWVITQYVQTEDPENRPGAWNSQDMKLEPGVLDALRGNQQRVSEQCDRRLSFGSDYERF